MSPIPVVVGLLLRNGKVLMCQRSAQKIYPLHWEFPGGKVEAGEELVQALRRELKEELDLEALSAEPWFEEVACYDNGMTYAITYFLVRDFVGEPKNLKFNELEWFDESSLKTAIHLSGNARILERIYREGLPR